MTSCGLARPTTRRRFHIHIYVLYSCTWRGFFGRSSARSADRFLRVSPVSSDGAPCARTSKTGRFFKTNVVKQKKLKQKPKAIRERRRRGYAARGVIVLRSDRFSVGAPARRFAVIRRAHVRRDLSKTHCRAAGVGRQVNTHGSTAVRPPSKQQRFVCVQHVCITCGIIPSVYSLARVHAKSRADKTDSGERAPSAAAATTTERGMRISSFIRSRCRNVTRTTVKRDASESPTKFIVSRYLVS